MKKIISIVLLALFVAGCGGNESNEKVASTKPKVTVTKPSDEAIGLLADGRERLTEISRLQTRIGQHPVMSCGLGEVHNLVDEVDEYVRIVDELERIDSAGTLVDNAAELKRTTNQAENACDARLIAQ